MPSSAAESKNAFVEPIERNGLRKLENSSLEIHEQQQGVVGIDA